MAANIRFSRIIRELSVNKQRFSSIPEARAARRAKLVDSKPAPIFGPRAKMAAIAVAGLIGLSAYGVYTIRNDADSDLAKCYNGSALESMVNSAKDFFRGNFIEPTNDKLIPDWPTAPCYGNVPPGTPPPPLLVLALERTLVGSEHDAKFGWRHAKRPGLDRFLKDMTQYYEVVIFSENDIGVAQDVMMAIDPEGATHKLGSAAAEVRGHLMLKRLDLMNRPLSKIILIDYSEESSQLFPRNTIIVPPFTDVNNKHDRVLEQLTPLLQAFVHDGVTDFRATLDDLGTHEAEEAVIEYRMRLSEAKKAEHDRRNRGLGKLIRGETKHSELDDHALFGLRSSVLSAKDIVGASPDGDYDDSSNSSSGKSVKLVDNYLHKDDIKPSNVKKAGYFQELLMKKEEESAKAALEKRKLMEEIYTKKQLAKQEKQQPQYSVIDDDDE